jgi:hypothetical protein
MYTSSVPEVVSKTLKACQKKAAREGRGGKKSGRKYKIYFNDIGYLKCYYLIMWSSDVDSKTSQSIHVEFHTIKIKK